jgi:hypothetical protein
VPFDTVTTPAFVPPLIFNVLPSVTEPVDVLFTVKFLKKLVVPKVV